MNLEEIREAARERDYEREDKLIISGSPEPVAFDLRGLAEAMAPKLEALAKQFAVATEKLADILDKAWTDIVAASETAPATGLRGEGASLLLDGMTKVINGEDEANWDRVVDADDAVDVFARAREMLGPGLGAIGSIPGAVSEAIEMDKKIAELSMISGESVESIKTGLSKLAVTSPRSRSEVLDGLFSERSGDLVAKLYAQERLVAVSSKLEATHSMSGAVRFEAKFSAPDEHQARALRSAALCGMRSMIQIEDGMATPYAKWTLAEVDVRNYYTSADRDGGGAVFFGFDVGGFT